MKFYKIKLPHTRDGYQYPPNYEETIGIFNQGHVYYDDEEDGMFTLLISVPDANAVAKLPENVTEVNETDAFAIANKYDPKVQVITNEAVVRSIEIKSRLNMPLSQKELDALDPTKDEPGFGFSQNLVDKVTKAKELEANLPK